MTVSDIFCRDRIAAMSNKAPIVSGNQGSIHQFGSTNMNGFAVIRTKCMGGRSYNLQIPGHYTAHAFVYIFSRKGQMYKETCELMIQSKQTNVF